MKPIEFQFIIYIGRSSGHNGLTCGETNIPQVSQLEEKESKNIMGDKSPKSNQKKSTQKQAVVQSADAKKKQAVAAKQAAPKKK